MSIRRPQTVSSVGLNSRLSAYTPEIHAGEASMALDSMESAIADLLHPREPRCHRGAFVFTPETSSFALDTAQAGSGTNLVNYILHSGQEYRFPVVCGGNDGVFLAHGVRFSAWQRIVGASSVNNQALQLVMTTSPIQYGAITGLAWTTKFSCFPAQPEQFALNNSFFHANRPVLNYAWNIVDGSGRQYADNLLPSTAMMNRSGTSVKSPGNFDGDYHRFDCPYRVETRQSFQFVFRPLMDVVQFDSTISGTNSAIGLPYDDREGGIRNQTVTVQAELVGEVLT